MTRFRTFLLFCCTIFCLVSTEAPAKQYAAGTPTGAIQELDTLLGTYIVGAKTQEDQAHNRHLKKSALHGTFDIGSLGKQAMAKHWEEISPKQQEHFVNVLSELLERKAIFAKEQGGGTRKNKKYSVSYQGHTFLDKTQQKALVRSWVNIPTENLKIALNYKLHTVKRVTVVLRDPILGLQLPVPDSSAIPTEWKIFDVIVDDASLLDNYRYQFDSIIRKDGYDDLIRRMESKLKKLKEKEN
jgi:ABC-type transporter MlaC component